MFEVIHNSAEDKPRNTPKAPCPEGTYLATIVKAEPRTSQYSVSDDNPQGRELSIWLDIEHNGAVYRVFDSIAATKKYRLNELLDALQMPHIDNACRGLDEDQLTEKDVGVRVYHSASGKAKAGEYLRVDSLPKKAQRHTAAAPKVTKRAVREEDIPF